MPYVNRKEKRRPWKAKAKGKKSKPHQGRTSSPDKRYHTSQWQRTRLLVLQRDPCCVLCEKLDRVTPSHVADHHPPVRMRWQWPDDRFYDIETIRGLCDHCHARVSGRQAHGKA